MNKRLFIKKTMILEERKGVIVSLLFVCFISLLSIAYGAMTSNLRITSEAHYRVQKDIRITGIQLIGSTFDGTEEYKSDYSVNTIKTGITLVNNNSTVTYRVKITNAGSAPIRLASITNTEIYNNANITYTINQSLPYTISPLSDVYIELTFAWSNYNASNKSLDSVVQFNFQQAESVLAGGTTSTGANRTFLNGSLVKSTIEKIQFLSTTEVPNTAIGSWDASLSANGSVIAWYMDQDSDNLYEVYIGGFGDIYLSTGASLFRDLTSLTELDFNGVVKTDRVTDMSNMFNGLSSLTSLDVSDFVTTNVQNMSYMFSDCSALTTFVINTNTDNNNFVTNAVTDMSNMFRGLSASISSLDLTRFNTSEVTNMQSMFENASASISLDLTNFNTNKVQNMSRMFMRSSITSINFGTWEAGALTTMQYFVYQMPLTTFSMPNLNAPNLTNVSDFFTNTNSLVTIDISGWTIPKVTSLSAFFSGKNKLETLNISNFTGTTINNVYRLFYNCSVITNIDISSFSAQNVTNASQMFYGDSALTSITGNFNFPKVNNITSMFYNCRALTSVSLSGIGSESTPNANRITSLESLFSGCQALKSVDFTPVVAGTITSMRQTFYNCKALTTLNLSNLDTSGVTTMQQTFQYDSKLVELHFDNLDTTSLTNITNFNGANGNKVATLYLNNVPDSMYDNSMFRSVVSGITISTATVYVKDSDCASKLTTIKATLRPVIAPAS